MGIYDLTIYTAACDVCDETYGDPDDFGWDWSEFSSDAEHAAINRGGWTKHGDLLVCPVQDDDHANVRGEKGPDGRPVPGDGQLALEGVAA